MLYQGDAGRRAKEQAITPLASLETDKVICA